LRTLHKEESPDFTGEDASETLGAARLRKVQQKTFRFTDTTSMGFVRTG